MSTGLQDLAKRHFGFAPTYPNSLIPKSYLATLEQHLAEYPFDDNFTLVKQAKKGYGILTCREEGCNMPIPLTAIVGRRDGGKQAGIGSLSAFHEHIETHPTHKRSCLRRRARQANHDAQSDAKEGILMNERDRRVDALIRVGNPSQSSSCRVSEMHSTAAAMGVVPSRKRHSDMAFHQDQDEMDVDAEDTMIPAPKKLKQEISHPTIPNSPLTTKTNTVVETKTLVDVDEAREHLQDVVKDFMDTEAQHDRLQRKKVKSKADLTRIAKVRAKLEDLRRQKDELKSRIPTMTNPRKVGKSESLLAFTAQQAPSAPIQANVKHVSVAQYVPAISDVAYMRVPQAANPPNRMVLFESKIKDEPKEQDVEGKLVFHGAPQHAKKVPSSLQHRAPMQIEKSHSNGSSIQEIQDPSLGSRDACLALAPAPWIKDESQVAGPSKLKIEPAREASVDSQSSDHDLDTQSSDQEMDEPVKPLSGYDAWAQKKLAQLKVKQYWKDLREGRKPGGFDEASGSDDEMPGAYLTPPPVPHRLPAPPVRTPIKFEDHLEHMSIASGSNVRIADPPLRKPAAFPVKVKDDSDGGNLGDEDNVNVPRDYFDDSDDSDAGDPLDYERELRAIHKAEELMGDIGIRVAPVHDARDSSGLYYGRGRDLYAGPQANPDDIDKFLLLAGNAEQFDGNASVEDALHKLGLKNQFDLLPGMAVSLMAHQLIGVAWMLEKERGALKGGCLADDMGLGKTVQMISVMIMNRSTNPEKNSTLILAPLALLDQWKMEIEMKTNADLKVLIYHGPNRPRRVKDIRQYDVVLTTYSTMAAEWPDYEMQAKKKKKLRKQNRDAFIVNDSDEDLHDKARNPKQEAGLLFQVEWYRISLDEGQNIRNRTTRVSRAASELRASYRWVLTGTPIINSLTDCYGYLRFLMIRPWYDWQEFNHHIARKEKKSPALAVTRLQAIIKLYQIRRTKESELDGKRLIELPSKDITVTQLEFTEEERSIYTMVEARSQATFNRFLRAGTVLKNYHQVLVLLLRLRQICSHPCLIQEDVAAFVPREEVDNKRAEIATEATRARNLISQQFVDEVKKWMKNRVLQRMAAEKNSADAALEDEDCPVCLELMDDTAVFAECKHVFCKDCIHGVIDNPPVNANGNANDATCPKCRGTISKQKLFTRSAFEPTDKELRGEVSDDDCSSEDEMDVDSDDDDASYGKGRSRPKRSTRRKVICDDEEDDDNMSDFIVDSDEDEEEKDARRNVKKRLGKKRAHIILDSDDEMDTPEESEVLIGKKSREQLAKEAMENMSRFLPSTKMKYMMQLVLKSFEKHPDEKILVISQWTSCLSLVSDYLTEKGIVHVKYQGDMDRNKRDQAVRVFMSKDKARIMLMSLKCGGVGLNLTRANNVISLDLAWSRAVESQAWDRVHRLGQTRQVNVQRLVISNTVEDRIVDLQNRKQLLADGSLGEGTGKKMGRLTVGELANLFGLDARGRRITNN